MVQILKSEKGFVHKECIDELNNKIKEDNRKNLWIIVLLVNYVIILFS